MEKYIEDLEKYIIFANKEENFSDNIEWNWHKELAIKIKNIINRNKELEEAIDNFMQGKAYSTKQLENINKKYIPKSKVKEKIEEYENEKEQLRIKRNVTWDSGVYKIELKIVALQELLEEGD